MARPLARPTCLLLIAAGVLSACGESPRDQLRHMGVPFSVESFMKAAEEGDLHVVRLFLDAGMTATGSDAQRRTLLAAAAAGPRPEVVAALLDAGADPNVSDEAMRTPLMAAAEAGHAEAARLLLAHGANANSLRDDGVTVLMLAADGGHRDVLRQLLGRGVEIDRRDRLGRTALLHAAAGGHAEAVALLVAAGADPDRRTRRRGTHALGLAAEQDDVGMATALLDAGVDLERRDLVRDQTALAVAAGAGSAGVARLLLERGADPEARDRDGNTPLMIAADGGRLEIVRDLLAQGALVDARTGSGLTALMSAAREGHDDVVRALLEAGADPRLETEGRYSALSAARQEGHDAVFAILEQAAGQRRVESPDGRRWARFAVYADAYRTPPGWEAVDPFSSDEEYWPEYTLLGVDRDESPRTRRALLRSERLRSQILLVRGPVLEWMPRVVDGLAPLDGRPEVRFTDRPMHTADGLGVDVVLLDREASEDTPARRQLLGIVDLGREALLVDAGGPPESFDPALVEQFLRSLRVRTGPPPDGAGAVPASPASTR